MTVRTYASAESFKAALEQRLRNAASGALARHRQLIVFDRFLARVVAVFGEAVVLEGGLVLELRLERARTTRDIDLRLVGDPETVLLRLQQAGRQDFGDFMRFEVSPDAHHPEIQNDGMPYDGRRFRAECQLAGKLYGQRFGVDVAFGDPLFGAPEEIVADDVLAFAGIRPPVVRVVPVETHLAEKLHAYTLPRTRPNSRVKDLPDIALLASTRRLDAGRVRDALAQTFAYRKTHPLPNTFPSPASTWASAYAAMAREDALAWTTLEEVTRAARAFFEPVLVGQRDAAWDPASWPWEPHPTV